MNITELSVSDMEKRYILFIGAEKGLKDDEFELFVLNTKAKFENTKIIPVVLRGYSSSVRLLDQETGLITLID